ncbi:MAG: monovalent cation/H+ antiporter complex subunit F [Hadesarchaea archaeon]|nr:monovalent cation/H+ antiporter complex subunit F [Hadesarchaea archaeon]
MISLGVLIAVFGACLFCAVRAALGPTAPDRVVAIDAITALMVASLVLLGIHYRASIYLDVALVYAFLAFLGTLAISKYLEGRGIET